MRSYVFVRRCYAILPLFTWLVLASLPAYAQSNPTADLTCTNGLTVASCQADADNSVIVDWRKTSTDGVMKEQKTGAAASVASNFSMPGPTTLNWSDSSGSSKASLQTGLTIFLRTYLTPANTASKGYKVPLAYIAQQDNGGVLILGFDGKHFTLEEKLETGKAVWVQDFWDPAMYKPGVTVGGVTSQAWNAPDGFYCIFLTLNVGSSTATNNHSATLDVLRRDITQTRSFSWYESSLDQGWPAVYSMAAGQEMQLLGASHPALESGVLLPTDTYNKKSFTAEGFTFGGTQGMDTGNLLYRWTLFDKALNRDQILAYYNEVVQRLGVSISLQDQDLNAYSIATVNQNNSLSLRSSSTNMYKSLYPCNSGLFLSRWDGASHPASYPLLTPCKSYVQLYGLTAQENPSDGTETISWTGTNDFYGNPLDLTFHWNVQGSDTDSGTWSSTFDPGTTNTTLPGFSAPSPALYTFGAQQTLYDMAGPTVTTNAGAGVGPVTNLASSISGSSLTLSWTAPAGETTDAMQYNVAVATNDGAIVDSCITSATQCIMSTVLQSGVQYNAAVTPTDTTINTTGPTEFVVVQGPPVLAPIDLRATSITNLGFTLSWTDPNSIPSGATVTYDVLLNGNPYTGCTASPCNITGAYSGYANQVQVRESFQGQTSAYAATTVTTTTSPLKNFLVSSRTSQGAIISFKDPNVWATPPTYNVVIAPDCFNSPLWCPSDRTAKTYTTTSTSYQFTGLTNAVVYNVLIDVSSPVSGPSAPQVFGNFSTDWLSMTSLVALPAFSGFHISWIDPNTYRDKSPEYTARLLTSANGGQTITETCVSDPCDVTGLYAATTYDVIVDSTDAGVPSDDSAQVEAETLVAPASGLTASNVTSTSMTLGWTDPNLYATGETPTYVFTLNGDPTSCTVSGNTCTFTGLVPGAAYTVGVIITANNQSSTAASARVVLPQLVPPSSVTTSSVGPTTVTVSWKDTNIYGPSVTPVYTLVLNATHDVANLNPNGTVTSGTPITQYTVTVSGSTHRYTFNNLPDPGNAVSTGAAIYVSATAMQNGEPLQTTPPSPMTFTDLSVTTTSWEANPYPYWNNCANQGDQCTVPSGQALAYGEILGSKQSAFAIFPSPAGSTETCTEKALDVPISSNDATCSTGPVAGTTPASLPVCAQEGGTCMAGANGATILYGWNGLYTGSSVGGYYHVNSYTAAPNESVPCTNDTFGNPDKNESKTCWIIDNPYPGTSWNAASFPDASLCANEYGTCQVDGTGYIAFGAANPTTPTMWGISTTGSMWSTTSPVTQYILKPFNEAASTGIACNTTTFGDPDSGVAKSCSIGHTLPTSYTLCGPDGSTCTVGPNGGIIYYLYEQPGTSGNSPVFYVHAMYVEAIGQTSVPCDSDMFGDPSPGNPKTCYVQNLASSASPVPVDLSLASNVNSIYTDGTSFSSTGGFNESGYVYSANLLGPALMWDGTPFSLGTPNVADAVSSTTVSLPSGNYSALKMLAAAHIGDQPSQTFVVTYTDGSTATFTQGISGWKGSESYLNEWIAATTAYRDQYTGTHGSNGPWYLYGYVFNLDPTKTVQSIALPHNAGVVVQAITLF